MSRGRPGFEKNEKDVGGAIEKLGPRDQKYDSKTGAETKPTTQCADPTPMAQNLKTSKR